MRTPSAPWPLAILVLAGALLTPPLALRAYRLSHDAASVAYGFPSAGLRPWLMVIALMAAPMLVGLLWPGGGVPSAARWAFGLVAIGLAGSLTHALGAPPAALVGVVVVAGAVRLLLRTGTGTIEGQPRRWTAGDAAVFALLALPVAAAAAYTVGLHVHQWDAVAIWYPKALAILEGRPLRELPYAAYPNVGPTWWAQLLRIGGTGAEPVARLVFLAIYGAWIAALMAMLPRPLSTRASAFVAAAVLAMFHYGQVTSGYQDTVVMSVAGIAATLLGRALLDSDGATAAGRVHTQRRRIALAFVLAGSLGAIKLEGLPLAAIMVAGWMFASAWRRERGAVVAMLPRGAVAAFLGLALLWPVMALAARIDLRLAQGRGFHPLAWDALPARLARLPEIAGGFVRLGPWFGLPLLAAVVLSAGAWRYAPRVRRLLAWAWGCTLAHGLFVVVLYLLTNFPLDWHLRTALDRLLLQQSFFWLLAICVSALALDDAARQRRPLHA